MKKTARAVVSVLTTASLLALAACGDKAAEPSTAANPPSAPVPTAVAAEPKVSATPAQPDHFYAMTEDGEYGYQHALSDDDIKAGRATSALLMVRYLGDSKGVRSIKFVDGDISNVLSCSAPCKFVKSKIIYAGRVMRTETVPVTDGSVIQAVMRDAFSDRLTVYGRKAS